MKVYLGLLALLLIAPPSFAQVNPARLYEQQRGTQAPVQGVWHVYDRQGNLLREENYENYRLDGEMKIYYASGALKELLHYSDGLRQGNDKVYFENGGLQHEYNYEDNDLQGPGVEYYDSGEVKARETYNKGKLEGRKAIFYKNGVLKQSMNFEKGVLEDASTTFAEDGSVITEEHYTHGHLVGHNEYGDKTTFVGKSDAGAKGTTPPSPDTEPAAADQPTKI